MEIERIVMHHSVLLAALVEEVARLRAEVQRLKDQSLLDWSRIEELEEQVQELQGENAVLTMTALVMAKL